ncbi:MAG: amidase [Gammaproteobacteria bacterium]|nr:amidase [Gammaproteobacteria bacterium]
MELAQSCLKRATKLEPALQAFVERLDQSAMENARKLDRELAKQKSRGPLHGIPFVLKDVFAIAGRPTTAGSKITRCASAEFTATAVERLLSAGLLLIGTTRLPEFAFGGWGTNSVMGTPRNPWDANRHRVPGGSSSGAACAVAAGIVPVGIGTDTGGSVRIPASLCGLAGLKPTYGRIATDGIVLLADSLDTVGSLTRSANDAALIYECLSGRSVMSQPAKPCDTLRIGVLDDSALGDIDKAVYDNYCEILKLLRSLGATIQRFSMPDGLEDFVQRIGILIGFEGWRRHGETIDQASELMDPAVLARFQAGRNVTAEQYAAACDERKRDLQSMLARLEHVDALLTPTTPITAIPVEDVDESRLPLSRYTRFVNYLNLCAVAVPSGLSNEDLPTSIQLIAKPGCEALLLQMTLAIEQLNGAFPLPDMVNFESND